MYARETSRETRTDILIAAMHDIKLCAMVSTTADGMHASHLPVIVEQKADGTVVINGHMSRNNPHWQTVKEPMETIAIFQGANGYISPNWYQTKAETGKVVPTWGYIAVHAHGKLQAIDDRDWLHSHVSALTSLHEQNRAEPWAVGDAPDDYINVMLRGIVGVRLTVERIEGNWKLNQHRSAGDQQGATVGLLSESDPQLRRFGAAMRSELLSYSNDTL